MRKLFAPRSAAGTHRLIELVQTLCGTSLASNKVLEHDRKPVCAKCHATVCPVSPVICSLTERPDSALQTAGRGGYALS